jgi:hypothetical protein
MLKIGRKSHLKQDNQNWVGSKFFLAKQKKVWLSTVFWWKSSFFGLTVADISPLAY